MIREFTCIVCPNGCDLKYDTETKTVTGNKCPRGAAYATSEMTHPTRSICSTVRTSLKEYPVVSVRASKEVPKDMMLAVVKELSKVVVKDYLPINSIVVKNILNTGADIITTAPLKKGN